MVGFGMVEVDAERAKKESPQYLFKIVLIGDRSTGKTATLMRFSQDTFSEEYLTTIGVDFAVKTVELGGDLIKLQIWDTAGQERFRTITNSYYRGAQGIGIFCNLTDRESFENIRTWRSEIERYAHEDVSLVLVGTFSDQEENRVVTPEEFHTLAEEMNLPFIEVSAKTGSNVNAMFEKLLEKMIIAKKESRSSGGVTMSQMVKPLKGKKKTGHDSSNNGNQKSKTCTIL